MTSTLSYQELFRFHLRLVYHCSNPGTWMVRIKNWCCFSTCQVKLCAVRLYNPNKVTQIFHNQKVFLRSFQSARCIIYATQESAILTRISQQLFRWKENIGLKPYKIIMQGHNHTALIQHKGNEVWCLLPCLANSKSIGFGYIYSAKMIGSPPQVGYITLFNDKGKTDINSIKLTIIQ